jgi:hypothetical protein
MNDTDCHLHWLLHCNTVLSGIRLPIGSKQENALRTGE